MSEEQLKVFHDGSDWFVAADAAEARRMRMRMIYGPDATQEDPRDMLADFEEYTKDLGIICDPDGEPDEEGERVTLPASEWAKRNGKGILCSRDF